MAYLMFGRVPCFACGFPYFLLHHHRATDKRWRRNVYCSPPPLAPRLCLVRSCLRRPACSCCSALSARRVVGANRDEVLARPAAASHWHSFPPPHDFVTDASGSPSLAFGRDGSGRGAPPADACRPSRSRPCLAGIDVHPAGGGTWLGINAHGRFGALTNYTEWERPPLPQGRGLQAFRSRGTLVRSWLLDRDPCEEARGGHAGEMARERDADELAAYLQRMAEHRDEWPGFNVLAGYVGEEGTRIGYVSNRGARQQDVCYLQADAAAQTTVVDARPHGEVLPDTRCAFGLSNSTLHTPWSKVNQGQRLLDEALQTYDARKKKGDVGQDAAEAMLAEDIFAILAYVVALHAGLQAQGADCERSASSTPTGTVQRREDLASSIFIAPFRTEGGAWYGTRVATVLLVRRHHEQAAQKEGEGGRSARKTQWWERDVHALDPHGHPIRCASSSEQQRHYTFFLPLASG